MTTSARVRDQAGRWLAGLIPPGMLCPRTEGFSAPSPVCLSDAGSAKPRADAKGENGSQMPIAMMARVVSVSGRLARLCRSGSRLVRMMWMTSVWVSRDSMNQPALAAGMTVDQIERLDLAYSPPLARVYDPVLIAASVAAKELAA